MRAPLPIEFHAGRNVRAHLAREGFRLDDFPTLLGAAGGPKWLALHGLDRVLAPRVRRAFGAHAPVDLIGSSIGAWRFAAWLQDDPAAALDRLFDAYTDPALFAGAIPTFDGLFAHYLDALMDGDAGTGQVLACAEARLHMVVSLFPAPALPLPARLGVLPRLGLMALRNALPGDRNRRSFLTGSPKRLVCSTRAPDPRLGHGWPHRNMTLDAHSLRPALMATAAVPGMISPVPGLDPERRGGLGIDGGLVDYHFDGRQGGGRFLLYPHFRSTLTPGWFDKPLRSRRIAARDVDDLLLICPSAAFVAGLPGGKVPDRGDPRRLGPLACRKAWRAAGEAALALGDALAEVLDAERVPELVECAARGRA